MAKRIRKGIKELNGNGLIDLPKSPPAGIEGVCRVCHAKFVTEEEEQGAKVKVKRSGRHMVEYGWTICCPDCETKDSVFFICVETTLANNQVNLKNVRIEL